MNVLADDNSFEKKDRSVNEPIFFYTGGDPLGTRTGGQQSPRRRPRAT